MYTEVVAFCRLNDIPVPDNSFPSAADPVTRTPRIRQRPKALDDFHFIAAESAGHADSAVTHTVKLRQQMYAILDRLTAEIDRRFTANKTELAACDAVYPKSQNFLNFELMAPLAQQFSYLPINTEILKAQLCVAKKMCKKSETVLTTPEDVLQLLQPMATAFPDLYKFIQLVLTYPVSSAEAERSFSCLKRVKTYLRSTIRSSA